MKFRMLIVTTLSLAAGVFAQTYNGWGKYKSIAVNTKATGANVAGAVTNIPVLIRLTASNAADIFTGADAALTDGADIRVSNADGSAAVPFEIERYDAASQVAEIWVLGSSIAGNDSVNTFRIYWKKADAVSASSTNVFTSANGYVGAWGLSKSAGGTVGSLAGIEKTSSVTGAPSAFVRNGLASVTGLIGLADSLNANGAADGRVPTGRYIDASRDQAFANLNYAGYSDFTNGFSYSIWVKGTTLDNFARILSLGVDSLNIVENQSLDNRIIVLMHSQYIGTRIAGVSGQGVVGTNNIQNPVGTNTPSFVVGEWTHFAFSKIAGTAPLNIYRNGAFFGATANASQVPNVTRNAMWVGRAATTNVYLNAVVDQIELSNSARSADYVKLSYETQKAASVAVTLGVTQNGNITGLRGEASAARYDFSARAQGAGAVFRIAESSPATVSVSDVRGQVVWSGSFVNGARELSWNGANASSGLYVARLTVLDKQGRASSVDRRLTLSR